MIRPYGRAPVRAFPSFRGKGSAASTSPFGQSDRKEDRLNRNGPSDLAVRVGAVSPAFRSTAAGGMHHLGSSHHSSEATTEVEDQITPTARLQSETLQDRREVVGDPASLRSAKLTPRPVQQFQVATEGKRRKSFLVGASVAFTRGMLKSGRSFIDLDRTEPSAKPLRTASFPLMITHRSRVFSLLQVINPILRSCEVALLGCFGNRRSHRVEIDIGRTGNQRGFIQQLLSLEARFPKVPGDFIFAVTAPSDILRRASHPPTDVAQAASAVGHYFRVARDRLDLDFGGRLGGAVLSPPPREQSQPTRGNLPVAPLRHDIRPRPQHQVQMITQHRVGDAFDGKDRCQEFQPLSTPNAAMFETPFGDFVVTAQKSSPYAAVGTVQHLYFGGIDIFPACSSNHEFAPPPWSDRIETNLRMISPAHQRSSKTCLSPFWLSSKTCLSPFWLAGAKLACPRSVRSRSVPVPVQFPVQFSACPRSVPVPVQFPVQFAACPHSVDLP